MRHESRQARVALVTGATGAIGGAIARRLAATPGFRVVLVARDPHKGGATVEALRRETGNSAIDCECADLSLQADIRALAQRWQGPLHVLVNAAAETPRERQVSAEGVERQFATNVLGYFRLIEALTPALQAAAPARVVNVASYWAGDLELEDLEFTRRSYNNNTAYRQSKQANRMLAVAFAERLKPFDIAVNACHPGDVNSTLSNNLGFGGHGSPDAGAATPVWLATDPIGQHETGKYFERKQQVRDRFGEDKQAVEALYQTCLNY